MPAIAQCLGIRVIDLVNINYATMLGNPSKAIAVMTVNFFTDIVILSMTMGMNGALETLVSQAHGAKEIGICGAVYKRAFAINTVIAIPSFICFFFTQEILEWFGYDPEVCQYAQKFVFLSMPKAYLIGLFDLTRLYLGCF